MKKIIIFFLVLSTFFANAQNRLIFPDRENGKYGAREYESKKIIVPFVYNSYDECEIECAKINLNKIWKTIDTKARGELAENFRTDSIYVTSENGELELKVVKELINKTGFVSKNGQQIIPYNLSYDELNFNFPQYFKLNNDWGFLCLGSEVCDENGNLKGYRGGGFYDCLGKEKMPFTNLLKYDYAKSGRVKQNNKWGKVDFLSGKEVIPIQFGKINFDVSLSDSIGNDLYLAKLNNKWGVINNSGKEYVPFKYDEIGGTSGNYLVVKQNNKWGLIDINEKEILPFIYDSISGVEYIVSEIDYIPDENGNSYPVATKSRFDGGIAFLKVMLNNKWGLINLIDTDGNIIDKTKREILSINYNDIVFIEKNFTFGSNSEIIYNTKIKVKINDKYGFVDLNGKEQSLFFDEIGEYLYNKEFQQELAPIKLNGKWGFVNKDEKEIVPCIFDIKYQSVGKFYNGLAKVKLNDKFGFADSTGKEIIPCKYDDVQNYAFSNRKIAAVKINNKWGFINRIGREITPVMFDEISHYYLPIAVKLNNKWGFIDESGKEISPIKYDEISPDYFPFAVKLNNKWGFVNSLGIEIVPPKYDAIKSGFEGSTLNFVRLDNKCGAIDIDGKEIIPLKYDIIDHICSDRYAYKVMINDKWGILNETGNEIIPVIYDQINTASGYGCAFYSVKLKNKWGVVNQFGKEVLSLKFDSIGDFGRYANSYSPGYEDYVKVKSKNLWGLINIYKNEEILPIKYQEINCVESISVMQENTNAEYRAITFEGAGVKQKNKWGLVGTKGKVIVPIKYDELDCPNYDGVCKSCFSDGKMAFKKGDNIFYFDKNGNEIKN